MSTAAKAASAQSSSSGQAAWILLAALLSLFVEGGVWLSLGLIGFAVARLVGSGRRRETALLVGVAVVLLVSSVQDDVTRLLRGKVRVWNVYHYYLGAKYFTELGYTDLYLATLAADVEGDGAFVERADKVRDLRTYEVVRREHVEEYSPEEHFSAARWQQFKKDARALRDHRSLNGWRNVFRDRGYNGTPLWTTIGRALGRMPADSPGLLLLCSLDLVLLVGTGLLAGRAFGGWAATLALLLFVASPANVARLAGGLLQVDWLCAIVASVCLYRLQRERWAGLCMAYAVMTRVFPVVLVAALCLPAVFGLLQRRWPSRRLAGYLASLVAGCLLAFLIGLGNGRGLEGWTSFVQTITVHREQHVLGDRRIGLEHAFGVDADEFGEGTPDARRAELLDARSVPFVLTSLLLCGGFVLAVRRRDELDSLLLGVIPLFALMVLSRYYFGVLALLPWIATDDRRRRAITASQLGAFLGYYLALAAGADQHSAYAVLNGLLALHLLHAAWLVARAERTTSPAESGLQDSRLEVGQVVVVGNGGEAL